MNMTISLFLKIAISILIISNHTSFRVLFDKIASVKSILIFSTGSGQSMQGTGTVPIVSAHLRSLS